MKSYLIAATALTTGSLSLAHATEQTRFIDAYQSITTGSLSQHVQELASDKYQGRLPTTEGEELTLAYLVAQFKTLGLKPGNGDSYLQPVPMQEVTTTNQADLMVGDQTYRYRDDVVMHTRRFKTEISISDSEIVFVGYGINAPERDWNDYQGLDVKGKTVVILVNDPGFARPDAGIFEGKAMTYYGRWTYKYEEASRQGAAAALIVHQSAPASYGWQVVENGWTGPQYDLLTENGNADRVPVEGWLSLDATKRLFAQAGLDFAALAKQAAMGPTQQSLNLKASARIESEIEQSVSNNVVATWPGSDQSDEHIIYSSHWDHMGVDTSRPEGDQIFNGAHDNATGTSGLLEVAKAFSKLPAPKRSVTFVATTAEEQGLLGSHYYANNPVYPLEKTVANINMDSLNVFGRTRDVTVVGYGKSDLERYLADAAKRQQRNIAPEARPEKGSYFRSDHFSFALKGVPAIYAGGGAKPIDEVTANYRKRMELIVRGCYHQPCDRFRDSWDLTGAVQDLQLMFEMGYNLADSQDWPKWSSSSEFQRPQQVAAMND